jgi:predicted alpha/beta-hydrolase family hydrolase
MAVPSDEPLAIETPSGRLAGLLRRPPSARLLYVLAHGAGAGMRHPFLETVAGALAARAIATLRYEFPYMQAGARRPDPAPVLEATVRATVEAARGAAGDLPLVAGGKSMGGRMTSRAAAAAPLAGARGLVFLGFPLHPAGRPGTDRAEHLSGVDLPMLFLQGTRDALADLPRMRAVCEALGPRARLHVVDGADHSFAVLKRSGRTGAEVIDELGDTVAAWWEEIAAATAEG